MNRAKCLVDVWEWLSMSVRNSDLKGCEACKIAQEVKSLLHVEPSVHFGTEIEPHYYLRAEGTGFQWYDENRSWVSTTNRAPTGKLRFKINNKSLKTIGFEWH